jgi:hypothetical protein
MQHFLLTGAGFSYNWGGYLASEAFEFLLSVTDGDDDLRRLLWRDHQAGLGFEDILAKLQDEYNAEWTAQREQDLRNLTSAVHRMFGTMAQAFKTSLGPPGLIDFLAKFDAIFTLNQDTLLEQQYIPHVGQNTFIQYDRLSAAYRPGIVTAHDSFTYGAVEDRIELYRPDDSLTTIAGLQPYIKLHGSIDIKQNDREMMLISGGNKAAGIAQQPLLKWYSEIFQTSLRSRGARLMIIGYSFGDAHINQMIFSGVEAGLQIFIIDPLGIGVMSRFERLRRCSPLRHVFMTCWRYRGSNPPLPLNPDFRANNAIIGASRRPLRTTLSGRDTVELNKINRFFRTGHVAMPEHPGL